MNKIIAKPRRLPAALLLAFATALPPIGVALLAPSPAHGQQARSTGAPAIDGLEVNADAGLSPGSTLEFKVRGTPKSSARVQVTGSKVSLPLTETQPGVYTGSYTVRKSEPGLVPKSTIRADLTRNGRTASANFKFPVSFAMLHANSPQLAMAAAPKVDRFLLAPVERLEPGTELKFTLDGTPGAKAFVHVPGLATPVPMQEERPGRYVASYTLRKADRVAAGPISATLRQGDAVTTAKMDAPPVAGASAAARPAPAQGPASMGAAPAGPLTLQVTSPGPNAVVEGSQVVVQGRTAPGAEVRVRVHAIAPATAGRAAVAQSLGDQKVLADANGNFSLALGQQRFAPGTRFDVQLSARHGTQTTAEQRLTLIQG